MPVPQVEIYADALNTIVATAKSTDAPTTMDMVDLILTAAFVYCTDEAKMSAKEACDFVDSRLGLLFEKIGLIERGAAG